MKLLDVSKSIVRGTNILDVEVPPKLRVKHPTSIDWIDMALGQNQYGVGFTPSTSGFITGSPGAGKTTLMLTIADALTSQGHVVLLNGGEESVFQMRLTCERLGFRHGFEIGDNVFVDDLLDHARSLLAKVKSGKALFVFQDSLQVLDDGAYDTGKTTKRTPINCAVKLIKFAKETYSCVTWVHQVTKSGVFVGDNQVKHAVDTHINLGFDLNKKSATFGERVLDVKKNRFGTVIHPIIIEMGEGGRLSKKDYDETINLELEDDELDQAAE